MSVDDSCRVTVVGTRQRVDVTLPADAPVAEYTPTLVRLCGQEHDDESFPAVWSLAPAGGRPLPPHVSLGEADVLDGATLYLRDAGEGEFDEPVVTDIEDLVSSAGDTGPTWDARRGALTALVLGLAALIGAFAVGAAVQPGRFVIGFGAAAAAMCTVLIAGQATRNDWALPLPVRVTLAMTAAPLVALAGYAVMPADAPTGLVWTLTAAGWTIGACGARLAVPHVCTLATLTLSAPALPLAAVLTVVGADRVDTAAAVALLALGALGMAPTLAGQLAAHSGTRGNVTEEEVPELVRRGARTLVTLSVLVAVVLAGSLIVLAGAQRPFAVALALCMSLALLLRAGQTRPLWGVVPVVAAGFVGLAATAVRAPALVQAPEWTGPVVLLVAGCALVTAGLIRGVRPAEPSEDDNTRSGALGSALSMLCLPLAIGVFGVFGYLMEIGRNL
ncbi:type VII secretion integral membrane protein EccD [Streptomyces shenzhenensis]|uniref:type VII secretion integral membrane protein EccD n=1 Tax=Streptomyces shenzhenensis TaxID=943815 RepID=UPI0036C5B477